MAAISLEQLPPELRLLVWDAFLLDDALMRRGLVFDDHTEVMPITLLSSPLLLVNKESHEAAIRHYSRDFDVFRVAVFDNAAHVFRVSPCGYASPQSLLRRLHFFCEDAPRNWTRYTIPESGDWVGVARSTSERATFLGKIPVNHFKYVCIRELAQGYGD